MSTETGNLVPLPPNSHVYTPTISAADTTDCMPPNSLCQLFAVKDLHTKIGLRDVHLLAFEITSPKKQNLDLTLEIATDGYENLVFMTKTQTVPAHAGNTLVGLDTKAAEAAQRYFVSGNTVTLSVRPKDSGVTVKAGRKVDRGEKQVDR